MFPLYLYSDGDLGIQRELVPEEGGRRANLAREFVAELERKLGRKFVLDGRGDLKRTFGPEDILNFAYAIFHAPSYRGRYAEFLKLDFPRLPLTTDAMLFRRLCECGARLVSLHTMREPAVEMVSFDVPGDNVVEQVVYVPPKAAVLQKAKPRAARQAGLSGELPGERARRPSRSAGVPGRVCISPGQYFEGVLPVIWEFRVGGYQVCEKWLKDRRGRALDHDDIEHYQHLVSALSETRTLMAQINSLVADHGDWPLR